MKRLSYQRAELPVEIFLFNFFWQGSQDGAITHGREDQFSSLFRHSNSSLLLEEILRYISVHLRFCFSQMVFRKHLPQFQVWDIVS